MIRSYIEFGCACWFFAGLAWFLFAKSYPGRPYVRVTFIDVDEAWIEETLAEIHELPETTEEIPA